MKALHALFVNVLYAAKAHEISPKQAALMGVVALFCALAPTAFFYGLGLLYQATH